MTAEVTLLVLAKTPVPGQVKTRLTPVFTPDQAAILAKAALEDTLAAALATPSVRPVLVLDGEPGPWCPPGVPVVPQVDGELGERIGAALDLVFGEPALVIGMDTPQLTPDLLQAAATDLRCGAAFGPARDGGWWALGLASADGSLVRGVRTSTAETGHRQRRRLVEAGLAVADLDTLVDVDLPSDAAEVAAAAPGTLFAAAWRNLGERGRAA